MAQSQIRIPTIEELYAANASPAAPYDPTKIAGQYATGMTLEDTIKAKTLERQKAEEDLKKEIQAAVTASKKNKALSEFGKNPTLQGAYQASPEKGAEGMFDIEKEKIKNQKEDTRQANYVRQLYTDPSGKSFAVLGKVDKQGNPVVVPVGTGEGQHQPFIPPTMPAEQVAATGTFKTLASLIGRLKSSIVDPTTGGISEKGKGYIGLFDAPVEKGKQYTKKASPEASNFYQTLQDLKNQIIYLRSGKQINEEEYKRLQEAMPSEYKDDSIFLANLENFERTFNSIMENRSQAFGQAGFRNPPPEPANGSISSTPSNAGGLSPEKLARLQELRAKKAQGTLGR
jgi:hypothetical protein